MATLVFDGSAHTLTLLGADGEPAGAWAANNRVDRRATFRFVPNQTFRVIDQSATHRHSGAADTLNGPYGRYGIIRIERFPADGVMHDGVGVHSGRANKGGADHPTMGCIRTTDEAMEVLDRHMRADPIRSLTVQNNREQTGVPDRRGDPNPPAAGEGLQTRHPSVRSPKAQDADSVFAAAVAGAAAAVGGLAALAAVGEAAAAGVAKGGAGGAAQTAPGKAPPNPPKGKKVRPPYAELFNSCVVNPERLGVIDSYAGKIIANKDRYVRLVKSVEGTVPWWFVGLVHLLEATLSFSRHLHNGDKLTARTVKVPKGRPTAGDPPFTWEESAEDALRHMKLTTMTDWSLDHVLHRLELFNGTGYWNKGIWSPYLWSFSNHYTKGKFVADGDYEATAVSQQAGAAVVLKRMVERGAVQFGS